MEKAIWTYHLESFISHLLEAEEGRENLPTIFLWVAVSAPSHPFFTSLVAQETGTIQPGGKIVGNFNGVSVYT